MMNAVKTIGHVDMYYRLPLSKIRVAAKMITVPLICTFICHCSAGKPDSNTTGVHKGKVQVILKPRFNDLQKKVDKYALAETLIIVQNEFNRIMSLPVAHVKIAAADLQKLLPSSQTFGEELSALNRDQQLEIVTIAQEKDAGVFDNTSLLLENAERLCKADASFAVAYNQYVKGYSSIGQH